MQNDARAAVPSSALPARIAAEQLLHRFVLGADSFLSDLKRVPYSAF